MADYIPSGSTIWTGTGSGGRADFRFKVTSSYSYANNQTTLTVRLQAKIVNSSSWLFNYVLQAGSVTIAGTTTTFNSDYYIRPTARDTWYDVLKKSDSTVKEWTATINHSSSGAASATLSMSGINLYYYSSKDYNIRLTGTYSGTMDLSQTRTYTLTISKGTGSAITVTRGGVALANGASITYGDVLTVTFGASSGYALATHTLNGTTFTSGNTHTVIGDVAVAATATVTPATYTLTIDKDTQSSITVKKGSTTLSDGDTITAGDVLTITFGTTTGYTLTLHTVNNANFTSGGTHTVSGDVTVKARSTQNTTDGGVWLYVSGAWAEYQAYIYENGAWNKYQPYIYTSNGWVKY